MIKITSTLDCYRLNEKYSQLKDYITTFISKILNEYSVKDISDFGAVYILENETDVIEIYNTYISKLLPKPIPEYVKKIQVKNTIYDVTYLEYCFVISDNFGITFFADEKLISNHFNIDKDLFNIYNEIGGEGWFYLEIYKEIFICFFK